MTIKLVIIMAAALLGATYWLSGDAELYLFDENPITNRFAVWAFISAMALTCGGVMAGVLWGLTRLFEGVIL